MQRERRGVVKRFIGVVCSAALLIILPHPNQNNQNNTVREGLTHGFRRMPRFISVFCLVLACACASLSKPRLAYEGHSTVTGTKPTVVDVVVTVRNTGSSAANLPKPMCPLQVIAYATPERNDEPLWKSTPDLCIVAPMIVPPIAIGPNDFYDFTTQITLPEDLAGRPVFLSMRVPGAEVHGVPVGQVQIR
jgi:hypothetical protein